MPKEKSKKQENNDLEELVRELVKYGILAIFGGCRESAQKYKEVEGKLRSQYSDEEVIKKIEEIIRN